MTKLIKIIRRKSGVITVYNYIAMTKVPYDVILNGKKESKKAGMAIRNLPVFINYQESAIRNFSANFFLNINI